jgi:hypothetical protein
MLVLAERMISASSARLHLGAPVAKIAEGANGVRIMTATGINIEASAAVVALGINQLRTVAFQPPLAGPKAIAISRGHGGRSFKIWAKMRGVPVGVLVTGDGGGIEFAFSERLASDVATMIVAFGLSENANQPANGHWVKSQISRLFPNATLLSYDWHDWVSDQFALGTWVAALLETVSAEADPREQP